MKKFIALWLVVIVANLSGAQAQNRPGAFAAAAAPGQVPAPAVATPQLTTPPAPVIPRPATPGQPGQQQQEQLRVVADPATNSLIIYGTVQEYQNVKNILKDLDAIPRQVLIEAMILQIELKDSEDFGVDYEILRKSRQTIFGKTFGSNAAITSLGKLFPAAPFFGGVNGLSAIVGDDTVSAMIRAAATDSRIKLISSPSVLASDNRPARIQVGSEEPIATGSIQQAVGGVAQSTTIQYRNTGRILTIIPQVNSQGLVNLQIKAEVSARGEDVTVGQDKFPAFNTQDAETTAVVNDGETLVIGGLIGELKRKGRVGVPYLMDIPVIGRFFGTTSDESTRTELIMLITPRVIRNRTDSRLVTADFKAGLEKVRDELERIAKDRARLLPPRPLPPLPDPNQYYQYDQQQDPAPTNPPVGPRSSLPPVVENVTVLSNDPITRRMMPPMAVPQEPMPVSLAQTQHAATQSYSLPIQSAAPVLPAPPAYIMSFTPAPPVAAPAAPAVPVSPAKLHKSAAAPRRIWTVQVAAVAESHAAESLAQKLRQLGYEAYVRVIQSENKIWHRVRVGQLESQKDAADLRNILSATKGHKNAYIALY
ncbi:MAG TPA: SPOR domain-containing protein [Candidatus Binatia bacterium]